MFPVPPSCQRRGRWGPVGPSSGQMSGGILFCGVPCSASCLPWVPEKDPVAVSVGWDICDVPFSTLVSTLGAGERVGGGQCDSAAVSVGWDILWCSLFQLHVYPGYRKWAKWWLVSGAIFCDVSCSSLVFTLGTGEGDGGGQWGPGSAGSPGPGDDRRGQDVESQEWLGWG